MPGMWKLGGHLGTSVSALVDGQLDPGSTERAWRHVLACPACRRLVEREGWVKRQLAEMAGCSAATPPAHLVGSLQDLDHEVQQAWAAVGELEQHARGRRRAGIAAVGVGSVSAAVLGLSTLSGAPLGIGGAPAGPPTSSLTRPSPTAGPVSSSPSRRASSAAPSLGTFDGWLVRDPAPATTGVVPVRSLR